MVTGVVTVALVCATLLTHGQEKAGFSMTEHTHLPGETWRVDINTADADHLSDLPGIGPALAEGIVALREERGGFTSTRDLLDVSGIGEATYEKIEAYIHVK